MRQFHPCQPQRPLQQHQQQQHAGVQQAQPRTQGPSAHARAAAPAIDDALDQAAALWTTRRIRSFFLLLDRNAGAKQR